MSLSAFSLKNTVSCLDIRGTTRRWLPGGSCAAGSLELLHIFYESVNPSVLLRFRKAHFVHLLFKNSGNRPDRLFARIFLPSSGLRGWKRGHLPSLSVRPLRDVS